MKDDEIAFQICYNGICHDIRGYTQDAVITVEREYNLPIYFKSESGEILISGFCKISDTDDASVKQIHFKLGDCYGSFKTSKENANEILHNSNSNS